MYLGNEQHCVLGFSNMRIFASTGKPCIALYSSASILEENVNRLCLVLVFRAPQLEACSPYKNKVNIHDHIYFALVFNSVYIQWL
jgi:hypothetical protein